MGEKQNHKIILLILCIAVLIFAILNLSLGSVNIPVREVISVLVNRNIENSTWSYIILDYRLPKVFTAILAGSGLALSGLLMQTLFRNPLAGPYVLGLSSGASLGVAILIMGATLTGGFMTAFLLSKWSLVLASSAGSLLVLMAVLMVSSKLRDTMAILIIGLMFASFTAAVVSVLAYFSPAAQLQQYIFWTFGSLGNLNWNEVLLMLAFCGTGILISVFSIKSLNSLLLGENYAFSMGVKIKRNRFLIIIATSLMAGSITAFAGPIAFVGLAVPHFIRQIVLVNDHKILIPAVALGGAILMLICDSIAQLPGSEFSLPINAVTSVIGAPVVIWLLVKKRKFLF